MQSRRRQEMIIIYKGDYKELVNKYVNGKIMSNEPCSRPRPINFHPILFSWDVGPRPLVWIDMFIHTNLKQHTNITRDLKM